MKRTETFPGHIKPLADRPGWYERKIYFGIGNSFYWDKYEWTGTRWVSAYQDIEWRGWAKRVREA